ncbi:MAG: lysophospholipid acyltransferase family protein [Proteobacteria bacterium]|nr:lysophospholipid acyltransferase family protein [Pseudomonadota bacterium]
MSIGKAIERSRAIRSVLCWGAAQYIRIVYRTGRWRVVGGETPARLWDDGKPFIIAFWHGRLLMMPYAWRRGRAMNMLISQHRDGDLIAKTIGHFGLGTVRGSSRHGGAGALRSLVRGLAQNHHAGITPDGPNGPRMRASDGIISVARLSGAPIVPVTYGASRRTVLKTWDRFVVPFPFSRGVFLWGKPIHVARDADAHAQEAARKDVEDSLNALTYEADRLCGRETVTPAPASEAAGGPASPPSEEAAEAEPGPPRHARA